MATKLFYAFCWANGKIEFGASIPEGALPCASPVDERYERKLKDAVTAYARHAYTNAVLLVPGVPERAGAETAMDWVQAFKLRVDWAMAEIQHGRNSRKAGAARAALLRAEQVCLNQQELA